MKFIPGPTPTAPEAAIETTSENMPFSTLNKASFVTGIEESASLLASEKDFPSSSLISLSSTSTSMPNSLIYLWSRQSKACEATFVSSALTSKFPPTVIVVLVRRFAKTLRTSIFCAVVALTLATPLADAPTTIFIICEEERAFSKTSPPALIELKPLMLAPTLPVIMLKPFATPTAAVPLAAPATATLIMLAESRAFAAIEPAISRLALKTLEFSPTI